MLRRLLFTLLVALTALTGRPAQAQPGASYDTLVAEGLNLYANNKNSEALDLFEQALKLRPNDFRAQYGVALVYYTTGRYAESAALCEQLVKRGDYQLPNLYVTYGTALDRQQKSAEAVQVYQQALRKFPADEPLWRYQGIALRSLRRYDEAAESFRQAVRLLPGKASAHALLGHTEANRQHRIPALLASLRSLTVETDLARAGNTLGLLDRLLQAGVAKTGNAAVSVVLSPDLLRQSAQPAAGPDSFAATETILTLTTAADYTEENRLKAPAQRLAEKLAILFQSLDEQPAVSRQGFTWEYYAPFFIELEKKGHTPALAYLLEAMRPGALPDVQAWVQQHPQQLQDFLHWRDGYQWPASPTGK